MDIAKALQSVRSRWNICTEHLTWRRDRRLRIYIPSYERHSPNTYRCVNKFKVPIWHFEMTQSAILALIKKSKVQILHFGFFVPHQIKAERR